MKRDILKRLSPEAIRKLARMLGHEDDDASARDVGRWLLARYVKKVSQAVGDKRHEIVERARASVDRVRSALHTAAPEVSTPRQPEPEMTQESEEPDVPDAIPSDPALRTATLAGVYDRQGMTREALTIYHELAEKSPDDGAIREAISRLAGSESSEAPEGAGPAVGAGAYAPARRRSGAGPVDLPDLDDLPPRYGEDEAVLMMVTPALMYAFWEVTPGTLERVRSGTGEGPLVLRLYRIAVDDGQVNEEVVRDLEVPDALGEYFIQDVPPGNLFRAAVGISSGGRFHAMVLTNAAATSSDGPSGRVDEEWMEVDQRALDVRGAVPLPLEVTSRSKLTAREMALLRLHALGSESYGHLTGIRTDELREILHGGLRRTPTVSEPAGSSGSLPVKR
ncbi:MAG: DUF4912 domain-containing protein [Deltaproteobacteria bacterium]|nr:DUF4912 domain-containing protein [Deltaproteobacteria bacterium]